MQGTMVKGYFSALILRRQGLRFQIYKIFQNFVNCKTMYKPGDVLLLDFETEVIFSRYEGHLAVIEIGEMYSKVDPLRLISKYDFLSQRRET